MIDELLEVASLVDQPTPYLETLAHCLHEKNEEDFHKNIAFFNHWEQGHCGDKN
ncbi:MAG: hypothetical protein KC452_03360 [Kurthia sp.]|nr:hypothetical protein [Kurthia sp.]